jgi:hypothetical protein
MPDPYGSFVVRYAALVVVVLVVIALLIPVGDGLSVTGFFGDKTYLLILQDNSEIRPTGGLLAGVGLLTMHNGAIVSLQYYYGNSSQLRGIVKLDGPDSLTKFFGVDSARLYDSNVQYDFASFAPKMQSDFYNATGQKVDGIIALDLTTVEEVMKITGPVMASGEVITSRNVADRLHYYSGTAQGEKTSLTDFLSTLTTNLARLISDSSAPQKLSLYTTLKTLENEGHLLIYPNQGIWLKSSGGGNTLSAADSIYVVDTTLGTVKADFGITRTIDYHVELLSDGSAISTLTLKYTNGCWWDYDVFSTTLVPQGAELIAVQNATQAFKGPLVTSGEGFTALSSRLLISANTTGSVTYTYKLPNVVLTSGIGHSYDLHIQKQAGIVRYFLNVSVKLPPGASTIHTENVGSNQVFGSDAHVGVVYT